MKKLVALSLILSLLSPAAPAQVRNSNILPRNFLIQRVRPSLVLSADQLRLRSETLRWHLAKERALRDGVLTPLEKRKFKKIKRYQHKRHSFKARRRPG